MPPNWKLFPLQKLHEIEPLKGYMEATTSGQVDQLRTKEECSNYSQHILGKVKTAGEGCGLQASSGCSLLSLIYQLIVKIFSENLHSQTGSARELEF